MAGKGLEFASGIRCTRSITRPLGGDVPVTKSSPASAALVLKGLGFSSLGSVFAGGRGSTRRPPCRLVFLIFGGRPRAEVSGAGRDCAAALLSAGDKDLFGRSSAGRRLIFAFWARCRLLFIRTGRSGDGVFAAGGGSGGGGGGDRGGAGRCFPAADLAPLVNVSKSGPTRA